MGDWQNIAVVGEPVAYGIGFLVLVLVAFTGGVAATIVRVAHEGGHMLAALISGNRVTKFELNDGDEVTGSGRTSYRDGSVGWFSELVNMFAGYATPPLAGLGGAYVVADGNAWGVLLIGVVLLLAVLLIPEITPFALAVTSLLLAGVLWALIAGGPGVQAALAVGLVWLLLIGGLRMVLVRNVQSGDVKELAAHTWIPRVVWFAAWLAIAVVSLWVGGRVLLGYA
jgi:hypothetical protein